MRICAMHLHTNGEGKFAWGLIVPDKVLFSTKKYCYFSYVPAETYVMGTY